MDQLLGGTRYLKARRRGHRLTAWRFAVATAEQVLRLEYEQTQEWSEVGRKLTTAEYLQLDQMLSSESRHALKVRLDFGSPAAMDRNLLALFHRMIELCQDKGAATDQPIPEPPITIMSEFLESELCRE
jgi:hypothetical protein